MGAPIKLQQWRYFLAVADCLNFRQAAQQLCITQPPLTRQIQQLEAALARQARVSLVALQNEPLFWFRRALNPSFHDHCERVFQSLGFAPPRLPEPDEHHVLLAQVAAGQGVALVPQSLRTLRRAGVVYRALHEGQALAIEVGLVWRPASAVPLPQASEVDRAALVRCIQAAVASRAGGAA